MTTILLQSPLEINRFRLALNQKLKLAISSSGLNFTWNMRLLHDNNFRS